MKVGFIGDTHGDIDFFRRCVEALHDNDCRDIVQVGDYGMVWPTTYGMQDQTDEVHKILNSYDINMRFIAGNHDPWPYYNQIEHKENNITSRITYQPRGSMIQYDNGSVFVFLGGAPSIDYKGRVEGRSWWPEEMIVESDVEKCIRYKELSVTCLVTHDAPVLPPGIPDRYDDMTFYYRAAESRKHVGKVMDELRPRYLIHGHYHRRYDSVAHCGDETPLTETKVVGIDCNYGRFKDSFYVLDLDQL